MCLEIYKCFWFRDAFQPQLIPILFECIQQLFINDNIVNVNYMFFVANIYVCFKTNWSYEYKIFKTQLCKSMQKHVKYLKSNNVKTNIN